MKNTINFASDFWLLVWKVKSEITEKCLSFSQCVRMFAVIIENYISFFFTLLMSLVFTMSLLLSSFFCQLCKSSVIWFYLEAQTTINFYFNLNILFYILLRLILSLQSGNVLIQKILLLFFFSFYIFQMNYLFLQRQRVTQQIMKIIEWWFCIVDLSLQMKKTKNSCNSLVKKNQLKLSCN